MVESVSNGSSWAGDVFSFGPNQSSKMKTSFVSSSQSNSKFCNVSNDVLREQTPTSSQQYGHHNPQHFNYEDQHTSPTPQYQQSFNNNVQHLKNSYQPNINNFTQLTHIHFPTLMPNQSQHVQLDIVQQQPFPQRPQQQQYFKQQTHQPNQPTQLQRTNPQYSTLYRLKTQLIRRQREINGQQQIFLQHPTYAHRQAPLAYQQQAQFQHPRVQPDLEKQLSGQQRVTAQLLSQRLKHQQQDQPTQMYNKKEDGRRKPSFESERKEKPRKRKRNKTIPNYLNPEEQSQSIYDQELLAYQRFLELDKRPSSNQERERFLERTTSDVQSQQRQNSPPKYGDSIITQLDSLKEQLEQRDHQRQTGFRQNSNVQQNVQQAAKQQNILHDTTQPKPANWQHQNYPGTDPMEHNFQQRKSPQSVYESSSPEQTVLQGNDSQPDNNFYNQGLLLANQQHQNNLNNQHVQELQQANQQQQQNNLHNQHVQELPQVNQQQQNNLHNQHVQELQQANQQQQINLHNQHVQELQQANQQQRNNLHVQELQQANHQQQNNLYNQHVQKLQQANQHQQNNLYNQHVQELQQANQQQQINLHNQHVQKLPQVNQQQQINLHNQHVQKLPQVNQQQQNNLHAQDLQQANQQQQINLHVQDLRQSIQEQHQSNRGLVHQRPPNSSLENAIQLSSLTSSDPKNNELKLQQQLCSQQMQLPQKNLQRKRMLCNLFYQSVEKRNRIHKIEQCTQKENSQQRINQQPNQQHNLHKSNASLPVNDLQQQKYLQHLQQEDLKIQVHHSHHPNRLQQYKLDFQPRQQTVQPTYTWNDVDDQMISNSGHERVGTNSTNSLVQQRDSTALAPRPFIPLGIVKVSHGNDVPTESDDSSDSLSDLKIESCYSLAGTSIEEGELLSPYDTAPKHQAIEYVLPTECDITTTTGNQQPTIEVLPTECDISLGTENQQLAIESVFSTECDITTGTDNQQPAIESVFSTECDITTGTDNQQPAIESVVSTQCDVTADNGNQDLKLQKSPSIEMVKSMNCGITEDSENRESDQEPPVTEMQSNSFDVTKKHRYQRNIFDLLLDFETCTSEVSSKHEADNIALKKNEDSLKIDCEKVSEKKDDISVSIDVSLSPPTRKNARIRTKSKSRPSRFHSLLNYHRTMGILGSDIADRRCHIRPCYVKLTRIPYVI